MASKSVSIDNVELSSIQLYNAIRDSLADNEHVQAVQLLGQLVKKLEASGGYGWQKLPSSGCPEVDSLVTQANLHLHG